MRSRRLLPIVALAAIAIAAAFGWRTLVPADATTESRAELSSRDALAAAARAERKVGEGVSSQRTEATSPTGAIPLPPFELRGQVLTNRGKPVEGAVASVQVEDNQEKAGVRHAATDREGRFRIVGLGRWRDHLEIAAPWGPRRVRDDADTWESRLGDYDFGVVEIPEEAALRGRVVDESGRPVARARIFAFPRDVFTAFEQGDRRAYEPQTATDADGRFSILGIDGEEIAVGTDAEGFGPRVDFSTCAEPRPEVRIALRKQLLESTSVVDELGAPIVGVRIETAIASALGESHETDAAGLATLRFDGDFDALRVTLSKTGYAAVASNGLKDRYVLHAIPSIRVRWDDHPAGRAGGIAKCVWSSEAKDWAEGLSCPTPFAPLPGGEYLVSFARFDNTDSKDLPRLPPFEPPTRLFARTDAFEVGRGDWVERDPRSGEIPTIVLRTIPTHTVRGRVVDERRRPLAGVATALEWSPDDSVLAYQLRRSWFTVSGSDGRFEFPNIPEGQVWVASASPLWDGGQYLADGWEAPSAAPVELMVRRECRIVGTLTIDGKPPGRAIQLIAFAAEAALAPRAPDSEEPSHYNFSVGAAGVLDCGPIDPGEYAFAACDSTDPNPVWWDLAVRGGANYPRAVLAAGQDNRLALDLHLTGGAAILGTVRSNDEPVPGAAIHYQESSHAQDPWTESSVVANDLGRYEVKLPHGGRYRIRVELDGVGESREIDLAPRAKQQIDFALRTAAVEGTVSDPLELAGELLVFAIPDPGAPGAAATPPAPRSVDVRADGRFEFHHLSEGNYRFLARNSRGSRRSGVSEPILVQRGGMLTIPTIAVQRWVSLELRLASRSAGPVQGRLAIGPADLCEVWSAEAARGFALPTSIFAWARLGAEIEIRCRLDGMSDWLEKRVRIPSEWPDFDKTLPIEIELP